MAFYTLEPFGREADFQGHAVTAAMVYNVHRTEKDDPIDPNDLMPKEPEPPQTAMQMKQFAAMITLGLGGVVEKEDE